MDKRSVSAKMMLMDNPLGSIPALTIVVTPWNSADMVLNAVDSVLAQDCQELLEVAAVDDGSTDGTPSALTDLEQRSLSQNRLVRVIHNDHRGQSWRYSAWHQ